ncbi:MAG TPA: DUF2309 domain-containing protein [Gemmataceae bacterium]|nr:DUF2309 domain-containing protein [Gemmataceae bacterium]
MSSSAPSARPATQSGDNSPDPSLSRLNEAIEHAAHLLPAQGPITVFIHHNTLHAFEDLPFTEAVVRGARLFGCHPYLTEDRYREKMARGRIRIGDLHAAIRQDIGSRGDEKVAGLCTRAELRLALLQYPVRSGPVEELLWFVAETDALRRVRSTAPPGIRAKLIAETREWATGPMRRPLAEVSDTVVTAEQGLLSSVLERFGGSRLDQWTEEAWEAFALQAMWRACCDGASRVPAAPALATTGVRHRDLLLQVTGKDADKLVHEFLIPFCGAFLDQGLAHWRLPGRDRGFFRAFRGLYAHPGGPPAPWRRHLSKELERLTRAGIDALESVRESLTLLGVGEVLWEPFLSATLLALRGWAGMTRFLEERPDRAIHPVREGSLTEFLAVRLILDRLSLAHAARETIGFTGPLAGLRDELRRRLRPAPPPAREQRAFQVFHLAQVLGWGPGRLCRLTSAQWRDLLTEIDRFSGLERRRVFQLAFEHRFYTQALDAVALHARRPWAELRAPRFQALFCIDEREESIRRHLEEVAPGAETFGMAGFFAVAMYYKGVADAHFTPLCPAVFLPRHWVVEKVSDELEEEHLRKARARRALGVASHQVHVGSRAFALGALTAAAGVVASVPLVARTLAPRLTARVRSTFGRLLRPPPRTRLALERTDANPGPTNGGIGYSLDELTAIAERVLRETGLTRRFSRLVFVFGHGSTSMNNPHESAHDCGACGGARGGPNARALAQIFNDPRVRAGLAARGLHIPADTFFVGAMHNTSNEAVTYYDLDCLPESHRAELDVARGELELACDRDAHERCRRFGSAPLDLSFEAARQHVEGRAEDLAQVRPEWGHATNAICVIGRRARTRGLFLDRRAFLNSYDPTQDDIDATVLTRVLHAAVPVCGGINLEYYFSYVDNTGWGCGTKLPHNIACLLGVMDGAASDLRTGLPWQMVEIHEPVRLLFVIETTPDTMLRIIDRNPPIGRMIRNEWVRLATLDPRSDRIDVYRDGAFHEYRPEDEWLPRAPSSVDWYRGQRDHLEFAEIGG